MHDSVYAKCERVVVGWSDGCSSSCSDMGKDYLGRCVCADGPEVQVVERRLDGFVEYGVKDWSARLR